MSQHVLEFSREFDLPPGIVWDGLVDEVLLEGWLALARVEPRVGGEYVLEWQGGTGPGITHGLIRQLDESAVLHIDTDNIGELEFRLTPIPGGTRGSGTALRLRISVETTDDSAGALASTSAYWQTNLDQLGDLLRGHPVDWSNWQQDRGASWADYRRRAAR